MELFRGYVQTNGKASIEKFKDVNKLKSLEEIKSYQGYAGVLQENTVLVDFDDEDMAKKALEIIKKEKLNCKVIQTTKGIHVYFKTLKQFKCNTKISLACGLIADIKCGVNAYGVLKIYGATRDVLYDTEEYGFIPNYFVPITTNEKNFLNKAQGDRNSSLFSHILTLQHNSFSKNDIKDIINLINNYIIAEPLDRNEIDVILRDESFNKRTFNIDGKFSYLEFAKFLVNEKNICKIDNKLHIYKDGVYQKNINIIEATMLEYIPSLKSAQRTEVLKTIELVCLENKNAVSENFISFNNGIYDLKHNVLLEHNPIYILTNKIPWNYIVSSNNIRANEILNQWACSSKSIRSLIEEIIGICLYRSNKISSAFILIGDKDNGKSSFIKLIRYILGDDNYSSIGLEDIETRFKNTEICGKLANLGDDIGDGYIPNTQILKKLITGDRVQFERKGQDPFEYDNYAKLVFSANTIPKIKDETGAVIMKRITIVPFNADFSNKKGDPNLYKILSSKEFIEYVIYISVEALKKVINRKGFTTCEELKKLKEDYIYNNDPVLQFIDIVGQDYIKTTEVRDILYRYKIFCEENGFKSDSSNYLTKGIERHLNLKKVRANISRNNKLTTTYFYQKKSSL